MFEIIPGILEKEWSEIEKKLELVKHFAHAVHIDILDGKFTNNTTFLDPKPFAKYTKDMFFEVHMMVEDPLSYLQPFADAGFQRFLGHVEKMPDQEAFVTKGEELGEVGLALDGPTPLSAIQVPFTDLDVVLIYTSERVGFSGASLIEDKLRKVKELRTKMDELFPIEIDGGVNDQTIIIARDAGVTRFVSTGFLYHHGNPKEQYHKLQNVLDS